MPAAPSGSGGICPKGDLEYCLEFEDEIVASDIYMGDVISSRNDAFASERGSSKNSGRVLLAAMTRHACSVWDCKTWKCESRFRCSEGGFLSCAFSLCGKYVATTSTNGRVQVWAHSTSNGTKCFAFNNDHSDAAYKCKFLRRTVESEVSLLYSASADFTVRAWDWRDAGISKLPPLVHCATVRDMDIVFVCDAGGSAASVRKRIVTACMDGLIYFGTRKNMLSFYLRVDSMPAHAPFTCITYTNNGSLCAVGSSGGDIHILETTYILRDVESVLSARAQEAKRQPASGPSSTTESYITVDDIKSNLSLPDGVRGSSKSALMHSKRICKSTRMSMRIQTFRR